MLTHIYIVQSLIWVNVLSHSCTHAATRWHAIVDLLKVLLWSFVPECFQIFYPETTDIYDRKNMPRCIYCIHALRYFLFVSDWPSGIRPLNTVRLLLTLTENHLAQSFYEVTSALRSVVHSTSRTELVLVPCLYSVYLHYCKVDMVFFYSVLHIINQIILYHILTFPLLSEKQLSCISFTHNVQVGKQTNYKKDFHHVFELSVCNF